MHLRAYRSRNGYERFGAVVDDRLLTGSRLERHADEWVATYFGIEANLHRLPAIARSIRRAERTGSHLLPLDARDPAPALQWPGKIVCVGFNYREHVSEGGRTPAVRPLLFSKFANAVIGDGEPIVRPEGTHALDLEVELGVVIGRRAWRVTEQTAMDHVAGYVVVNDVSARDWQGIPAALGPGETGDGQWLRAKGSDTFLPIGPDFVTADELDPRDGLRLRSWRMTADGVEHPMQDGTTRDLIWDVPALIAYTSAAVTLEPGDLIATGTPSGVGVFRDPPVFLEQGDRVRCEIEGIGHVENPVIDWTEVSTG